MTLEGTFLVAGAARGPVLATAPLSFWGGIDVATGKVIDRSHPALGRSVAGHVLVMPSGRGSSSSSSVLAEAIRLGTAPSAIVLAEPDPILVVGALVAERLYGAACPIVLLEPEAHARLATQVWAEIATTATDSGAAIIRTGTEPLQPPR